MSVTLTIDEITAIAQRVQPHVRRRDDGTLSFDADAIPETDAGVVALLREGIDHLNRTIQAGWLSVDEELRIQATPEAVQLREDRGSIASEMEGWWALNAGDAKAVQIACEVVGIGAIVVAVLLVIGGVVMFVIGQGPVAFGAGVLALFAAYIATNAFWLHQKIRIAREASASGGVKMRWRATQLPLDIFIVHQIEVEPL